MKRSRRNILKAGLAAIGVVVSGKPASASNETVRVLTKDGRVIDIPKNKVQSSGRKADTTEVENWLNQNDYVR